MSLPIENNPSPNVLMNSMRSLGYSFKTALSDIIDNSISARASNIRIDCPLNNSNFYVSILDDGEGMERDDLLIAMKYGSDVHQYGKYDLGRFGLGLKSASLSQCRVLTVASKHKNNISAFRWDLDFVSKHKKWECLELNQKEINKLPNINKFKKLDHGTIVIWQDFDTAYKKKRRSLNGIFA